VEAKANICGAVKTLGEKDLEFSSGAMRIGLSELGIGAGPNEIVTLPVNRLGLAQYWPRPCCDVVEWIVGLSSSASDAFDKAEVEPAPKA